MADSLQETEELASLFNLLGQKQQPDCSLQVQQQFYQKTCDFYRRHPKCVWCRFTPLTVELLHLYSLPPNPFTELFDQLTNKCLGSCQMCIDAYHTETPKFLEKMNEIYEEEAVAVFSRKLADKNISRLAALLSSYTGGLIAPNNTELLYAIFEILSFPSCLADKGLDALFCQALRALIDSKKMLTVTQVMPGVLFLAFHEDEVVRRWALSVLETKLSLPKKLNCNGFLGLSSAVQNSLVQLETEERLRSAGRVLYWYPVEILMTDYQWILELVKKVNLEDHDSILLLCIFIDKLAKEPKLGKLGVSNLTNFFKAILESNSKAVDLIDLHADFPINVPESILEYSYKNCVTQWIRLLCNLACNRKDGELLQFIVSTIIEFFPILKSPNAKNNLLSLLINIVHHITTSESLSKELFCRKGVRTCLEFLARYFLQHAHPHKPNPLLLETCKTCIQFDCNELELSSASTGLQVEEGELFQLISRLLVHYSEDKSVYEMMITVCRRLFVDSEGPLLNIALKRRRSYLNYIVRSWPLLSAIGPIAPNSEPSLIMVWFFALCEGESRFPDDYLKDFVRSNFAMICTCPSTMLKKLKSIGEEESDLVMLSLQRIVEFIERHFFPVVFSRSGPSLLDPLPNTVYLKLHLISAITGFLTMLAVAKESFQTISYWNSFFSLALSLDVLIGTLGLDALKQCLRENAAIAKRFKNLPIWMSHLAKHCSAVSTEKSKSLVGFVKNILLIAVSTKTIVPNLSKMMASFTSTFKIDIPISTILKPAVTAYEAEFNVKLGIYWPSPEQHVLVRSVTSNAVDLTSTIEDDFLRMLKENKAKESLKKPIHLDPIIKPATKLGQLKQEMARELQPVKIAPRARKPVNAAVHHTAKAVKLDVHGEHGLSSDQEDAVDFHAAFKEDLNSISNSGAREPGRSVKLIPLAENTGTIDLTKRKVEDEFIGIDPQAHIKKLHKYLLDLDIDSIDDKSLEGTNAKPIPTQFQSSAEYVEIFEPLLLFECRSQLLQAKLDLDSAACFSVKVMAISSVDDYHEVTIGAEGDENSRMLSEHDYIMARLDPREPRSAIVGMVTQASFKGNRTEAVVKFKFKPHQHQYQVELRIGLTWKVKKLCNWITSIREFSALHSIHDIRLSKAILNPAHIPLDGKELEQVTGMLEKSLEVNPSQAKAIAVSLNNPSPFTLIQGPPGTGKTRTILGLVGALFGRPYPSLSSKLRPQRLLICAPSNAAIDEIVRRLKAGVYDCYHQKFSPKILRMGSHEMIHEDVKDLTLDATIERTFNQTCKESLELLQQQRESVADLKKDLDFAEKMGKTADLPKMKQNLWQVKEAMKKNVSFIEGTRQNLRTKVVSEAQIICSTLSSSGIDLLSKLSFDVVIIDEACQAVEVSALIPLQYGCKHCILVGDPNQLPPTVISQAASVFAYEQSLFQRIQKASPDAVQLLSIQYRMHPAISHFPNRYFYGGQLADGPDMASCTARPWHRNPRLAPYRFYDIPGQERNQVRRSGDQGTSKSNEMEARSCCALVAYLCAESPDINFSGKIGIVTPYKDQRRTLKRELRRRFGDSVFSSIEVSTVDGYQGQEKEVIIFSCVRTAETRGIGFLADARRLNVALTRAKSSLFILGRSETLYRSSLWGELIKDSRERNCFVPYDERVWSSIRNAPTPRNLSMAIAKAEKQPTAPSKPLEASSFKIKTPMQRRREDVKAEEEKPAKKPLLLDSLLDKIKDNKPQ